MQDREFTQETLQTSTNEYVKTVLVPHRFFVQAKHDNTTNNSFADDIYRNGIIQFSNGELLNRNNMLQANANGSDQDKEEFVKKEFLKQGITDLLYQRIKHATCQENSSIVFNILTDSLGSSKEDQAE